MISGPSEKLFQVYSGLGFFFLKRRLSGLVHFLVGGLRVQMMVKEIFFSFLPTIPESSVSLFARSHGVVVSNSSAPRSRSDCKTDNVRHADGLDVPCLHLLDVYHVS